MFQFLQNWENIVPILLVGVPLISSEVTTGHLFVFFFLCVYHLLFWEAILFRWSMIFLKNIFFHSRNSALYIFFNTVIFIEQNFYFIEMLFYLFLKPFLGFLFFSLLIKRYPVSPIHSPSPQPISHFLTFCSFYVSVSSGVDIFTVSRGFDFMKTFHMPQMNCHSIEHPVHSCGHFLLLSLA